ncbi:MAG: CDP-alcohol phosphatidyltransferase family protein [Phycisphaerae bacterium]
MKLTWATRITILRILLIVPFVILVLDINKPSISQAESNFYRYLATFIFAFMAISDGVDGYVARRKKQVTRLGAFLDPVADKLLMTCACLLLSSNQGGIEGFLIPVEVVVIIIGKDAFLLIGFVTVYMLSQQVKVVPVTSGKIATALQLIMVGLTLLAPEFARVIPYYKIFLHILYWSAACTAVLTTIVYIRTGSRYIEHAETTLNNHR